ncbi:MULTISPECIES: hypothetical protein [unclassified Variovorax]|uniref:hypothetical protein n=1 Tax=unclassified Variovorax TaxID=663243 RepID=UPI001BD34977|nr:MULTISPECIES: hypothetical protein [unclassified Variovorax]
MTLKDHYRANGTLTADQIEYLLAVNEVVKAIDARKLIFQMIPLSETPLYKAIDGLRNRLRRLHQLADMAAQPEYALASEIVGAYGDLEDIASLVAKAIGRIDADILDFVQALPRTIE